jgi:hypothetical protein
MNTRTHLARTCTVFCAIGVSSGLATRRLLVECRRGVWENLLHGGEAASCFIFIL